MKTNLCCLPSDKIITLINGLSLVSVFIFFCIFQSDVTEAKYFATPLVLGPNGVEKNLGLGTLTAFEQVKDSHCSDHLSLCASHNYHPLENVSWWLDGGV